MVDIPSIVNIPSGSANRKRACMREDLPAPVRPTMPTLKCIHTRGQRSICDENNSTLYTVNILQIINNTG